MTDAPIPAAVPAAEPIDDGSPLAQTLPRIELDQFEGPFDVLLYLIRTQELDIFDIPILKITEQYLLFLEQMEGEQLEIAGEFIVMAATLIQIKSRMLIPVEVQEEEEEEIIEDDPRLELVEKLLEYRKFRDYSLALGRRFEVADNQFGRRVKPQFEKDPDEEELVDISLYDLMTALRNTLRYLLEKPIHEVFAEGASIEDKISRIEELLESEDSVAWSQLAKESRSRVEIVCCLLAILELCRMRRVRAHQHEPFGEVRLFARILTEEETADNVVEAEA
jgi:segregation and condensation protein A